MVAAAKLSAFNGKSGLLITIAMRRNRVLSLYAKSPLAGYCCECKTRLNLSFKRWFSRALGLRCRYNRRLISSSQREIPMRPSGRSATQVRPITITRNYTAHAEGSVLVEFGNTKVICTASVEENVPRWLKGKGQGWVTAEYGMLPRATHTRNRREAASGKQGGRTMEIQRLIARSLRAAVDLKVLGEQMITVDCDVIQADGGTRTASITGAMVALVDAINYMLEKGMIKKSPLKGMVAAVSVGIYKGEPICDLEYLEDSAAETDMNVVMTEDGKMIEIQGTAEGEAFSHEELLAMLALAKDGIFDIISMQKQVLEN